LRRIRIVNLFANHSQLFEAEKWAAYELDVTETV